MSSFDQPSEQISDSFPSNVAASMELVPSPEPFGIALSKVISSPPPRTASWRSSVSYFFCENSSLNPARQSAAFGIENDEPTLLNDRSCLYDVTFSDTPVSIERRIKQCSCIGRMYVCIGCCPFKSIAMFTTEPPLYIEYGGVSDQPPAKSMRAGLLPHTI